jgi:hypothetical protein
MRSKSITTAGVSVVALVLLALAPGAYASTLHVTNNGVDSSKCGPSGQVPCRSITKAIHHATSGDLIIVGPGTYGDLNGNGVLGEAGEEAPPANCFCMLAVNKAVTLASSDGAAATVIDASTVNVLYNVAVTANGTHFGKPGLGFMVTDTASLSNCFGIDLASVSDVNVRGNLVVSFSSGCHSPGNSTTGIVATGTDPGGGLIEGNQVMGWPSAINVGANIVNQNVVQFNGLGITGFGAAVTGNVVTDNYVGIVALKGSVTGNAVRGNRTIGI